MAVRVGVIGLGIGRVHLEHYRAIEEVEIRAVADTVTDLAEKFGRQYGAETYSDPLEMMDQEELDAVSICTPPKHHATLTVAAAERGLHVLCEKPMAPTIEECDRMIEAAERAGITLMIGFKKRYAKVYSYLKNREQEWGPPRVILARYQLGPVERDWFWDEQDGGGPLIENSCHILDILRYLMGDARSVYAETSNFFTSHRAVDVSEAVCTIRFRNGGMVSLAVGMGGIWRYDQSERISLAYGDRIVEVSGAFDTPGQMRVMCRESDEIVVRNFVDPSGFSEEFEAFIACVRGEGTPRATGLDGKHALELGLAIKRSGRTRETVDLVL